jgi:hypothetical protein
MNRPMLSTACLAVTLLSSAAASAQTCAQGYVWREARPGDLVCVTPESREQAANENRLAKERRNPRGNYGPLTCIQHFVWREAFNGDAACVPPERRLAVRQENAAAANRRISP